MNQAAEPNSRQTSLGFAECTRKNLLAIECLRQHGDDVHVVTQLVNSLLGLIVFPWERSFSESIKSCELSDLVSRGWPHWEIDKGECRTLGELIRCLRNGTSHGNIQFSSDSRVMEEVNIQISNYPGKSRSHPNFVATIRADQLREFCLKFTDLVFESIS